ncbi:HD domain-containing protein [Nocardia sp. NPDC051832]|uniref:HD domain-containing protein n=1 Tax=Nocardia sp. NPDC051832 TaxID=3155673 RepID=UPI0034436282
MTAESTHMVEFAYEVGFLKRLPRTGWLTAGVANPESVAEHSFRVAILAFMIAASEGADPERAAVLGLFHDLPETRIGDVPAVGRPYVQTAAPTEVVADQTANLPSDLAERIGAAIAEHESAKRPGASTESLCSRDADKLDLLLQAREYQEQTGNIAMSAFIDSMLPLFATHTGKSLAEAAIATSPSTWWNEFASKFGTPAATTRPVRSA